ncbi:MAG: META domain-containing protein [Betaproteobacteria bacterium]|nr:META domain-containing protein [Betaproteobacteria bacterium]
MIRFAVFLVVFLFGCAHSGTARMSIADEVWEAVWLEGMELPANPEASRAISLRLMDGRVQGYGGCNWIAGGYRLEGSQLTFSGLASTRRACLAGMEREDAFLKALEKASAWGREGDLLHLYGSGGKLLLKMEAVKDPERLKSLLPPGSKQKYSPGN